MKPKAHSRDRSHFRRQQQPNRVTLSPEGRDKLSPRFPMFGVEIGREAGLITVREDSGVVNDYHPDFIEHLEAR